MEKIWIYGVLGVGIVAFIVSMGSFVFVSSTSLDDNPSKQDYLVAICRDGSRIYTRPDGTHYARFGNRPVRNPETVCK